MRKALATTIIIAVIAAALSAPASLCSEDGSGSVPVYKVTLGDGVMSFQVLNYSGALEMPWNVTYLNATVSGASIERFDGELKPNMTYFVVNLNVHYGESSREYYINLTLPVPKDLPDNATVKIIVSPRGGLSLISAYNASGGEIESEKKGEDLVFNATVAELKSGIYVKVSGPYIVVKEVVREVGYDGKNYYVKDTVKVVNLGLTMAPTKTFELPKKYEKAFNVTYIRDSTLEYTRGGVRLIGYYRYGKHTITIAPTTGYGPRSVTVYEVYYTMSGKLVPEDVATFTYGVLALKVKVSGALNSEYSYIYDYTVDVKHDPSFTPDTNAPIPLPPQKHLNIIPIALAAALFAAAVIVVFGGKELWYALKSLRKSA